MIILILLPFFTSPVQSDFVGTSKLKMRHIDLNKTNVSKVFAKAIHYVLIVDSSLADGVKYPCVCVCVRACSS